MEQDYLDSLRYAVDYEIHYLGKWNTKEENKMDIPGKLRNDLKRIFGTLDPLNYIEDIRHNCNIDSRQDELVVTLRVPTGAERFLRCSPLYDVPPYAAMSQASLLGMLCGEGVSKAPEKKEPPKPIKPEEKKLDPMNALKPERIIYSGPKTIAFWPDGTKTMVSLMEGQEHDEYSAFCAAVVKKMFGQTHKAKKFLNSIKIVQEPKVKKSKEQPWEQMEMMPMPGTEDPDWGRKHWCPDAPAGEGPDNA